MDTIGDDEDSREELVILAVPMLMVEFTWQWMINLWHFLLTCMIEITSSCGALFAFSLSGNCLALSFIVIFCLCGGRFFR